MCPLMGAVTEMTKRRIHLWKVFQSTSGLSAFSPSSSASEFFSLFLRSMFCGSVTERHHHTHLLFNIQNAET